MYNHQGEFAEKSKYIAVGLDYEKSFDISLALIHLITKYLPQKRSQLETTEGFFAGLSKAFDTLDHQNILFAALQ